jgi:diaminopimelate epimerase
MMSDTARTMLSLTKHHGLGNDFLVADLAAVTAAMEARGMTDIAEVARRVCDRRTGIGADGLLLIAPHPTATAQMTLYNADGSRAEISGNGIRCFVQAIAQRTGDLSPQTILTDAGERLVKLSATSDPLTIMATVVMGQVSMMQPPAAWGEIGANPDRPVAHLNLGNPHTVVGVEDVGAVDLAALGAKVPDVNLEIVEPGDEADLIRMRVHERGAGITQACGTGACAAAYAAVMWGLVPATSTAIRVAMDGGIATVEVNSPSPGDVTLTGPATFVASVEYQL